MMQTLSYDYSAFENGVDDLCFDAEDIGIPVPRTNPAMKRCN